jgi:hypothetical protein
MHLVADLCVHLPAESGVQDKGVRHPFDNVVPGELLESIGK